MYEDVSVFKMNGMFAKKEVCFLKFVIIMLKSFPDCRSVSKFLRCLIPRNPERCFGIKGRQSTMEVHYLLFILSLSTLQLEH